MSPADCSQAFLYVASRETIRLGNLFAEPVRQTWARGHNPVGVKIWVPVTNDQERAMTHSSGEDFYMPEIVVHFHERLVGVQLADPHAALPQLTTDVATIPPLTDEPANVCDRPTQATDSPVDVLSSVAESGAST